MYLLLKNPYKDREERKGQISIRIRISGFGIRIGMAAMGKSAGAGNASGSDARARFFFPTLGISASTVNAAGAGLPDDIIIIDPCP